MKIRNLQIENFKGIDQLDLSFVDTYTGKVRPYTAILGDNASGKTSILQAIALTISLASKKSFSPEHFESQWNGFLADRIGTLGATKIQLELELSDQELASVQRLYPLWKQFLPADRHTVPPSIDRRNITLRYENGQVTALEGDAYKFALFGRYYIKALLKNRRVSRTEFDCVGDVFWFDQFRNLGQGYSFIESEEDNTDDKQGNPMKSWKAGIGTLRKHLVAWWGRKQNHPQNTLNYLDRIEEKFVKVFPGVQFVGTEPMHEDPLDLTEYYFLLARDLGNNQKRIYDFSEMSSGEQNIFSLLYEFTRMHISHSIVLIDELELHLHPPEQQALFSSLRHFGPDCQFIFTSHSPYLSENIPDENAIRLKGGRLWL
ncbi:MAG TPA: AAA family ATPase [Bacilli bacterium]|nr:AAA family ATPase [Bacilli bacterium]